MRFTKADVYFLPKNARKAGKFLPLFLLLFRLAFFGFLPIPHLRFL